MTGADLEPCPSGTYNPVYGMSNVNQCLQCDGGSYCLTAGLDSVTGFCQPGYYCISGNDLPSSLKQIHFLSSSLQNVSFYEDKICFMFK